MIEIQINANNTLGSPCKGQLSQYTMEIRMSTVAISTKTSQFLKYFIE